MNASIYRNYRDETQDGLDVYSLSVVHSILKTTSLHTQQRFRNCLRRFRFQDHQENLLTEVQLSQEKANITWQNKQLQ